MQRRRRGSRVGDHSAAEHSVRLSLFRLSQLRPRAPFEKLVVFERPAKGPIFGNRTRPAVRFGHGDSRSRVSASSHRRGQVRGRPARSTQDMKQASSSQVAVASSQVACREFRAGPAVGHTGRTGHDGDFPDQTALRLNFAKLSLRLTHRGLAPNLSSCSCRRWNDPIRTTLTSRFTAGGFRSEDLAAIDHYSFRRSDTAPRGRKGALGSRS